MTRAQGSIRDAAAERPARTDGGGERHPDDPEIVPRSEEVARQIEGAQRDRRRQPARGSWSRADPRSKRRGPPMTTARGPRPSPRRPAGRSDAPAGVAARDDHRRGRRRDQGRWRRGGSRSGRPVPPGGWRRRRSGLSRRRDRGGRRRRRRRRLGGGAGDRRGRCGAGAARGRERRGGSRGGARTGDGVAVVSGAAGGSRSAVGSIASAAVSERTWTTSAQVAPSTRRVSASPPAVVDAQLAVDPPSGAGQVDRRGARPSRRGARGGRGSRARARRQRRHRRRSNRPARRTRRERAPRPTGPSARARPAPKARCRRGSRFHGDMNCSSRARGSAV